MSRARPTVATIGDHNIHTVIVRDGARVLTAAEVVAMLEVPGATYRSVAEDLGIAQSALHRFIRQAGYLPVGRRNTFDRAEVSED